MNICIAILAACVSAPALGQADVALASYAAAPKAFTMIAINELMEPPIVVAQNTTISQSGGTLAMEQKQKARSGLMKSSTAKKKNGVWEDTDIVHGRQTKTNASGKARTSPINVNEGTDFKNRK